MPLLIDTAQYHVGDITLKCEDTYSFYIFFYCGSPSKLSTRSMKGSRLNVPAPYKYMVLWTVKHHYSNRPAHSNSMYFIVTLFAVYIYLRFLPSSPGLSTDSTMESTSKLYIPPYSLETTTSLAPLTSLFRPLELQSNPIIL